MPSHSWKSIAHDPSPTSANITTVRAEIMNAQRHGLMPVKILNGLKSLLQLATIVARHSICQTGSKSITVHTAYPVRGPRNVIQGGLHRGTYLAKALTELSWLAVVICMDCR
jgi:hypothetical protein